MIMSLLDHHIKTQKMTENCDRDVGIIQGVLYLSLV